MTYTVAIIGTGAKRDSPDKDGYAMAYRHGPGYERLEDCELVACADIVRENALAFADEFGIAEENVFEDYEQMIRIVEPDIVSVCVPPKVHASIVQGCAESGVVQAIHCEKPMAMTPAECDEMVESCEANDVQLTIDHQRRFAEPFRRAKELLDDGKIGDLERVETSEVNLFDAGCHCADMVGYMTDQAPAEWVLAAVDYHEENIWFGVHNENQAISQWRYENGVHALVVTGDSEEMVGAYMRLVGSDGEIEIGVHDGPTLRVRSGSGGWKEIDTDDSIHGPKLPGKVGAAVRKIKTAAPGLSVSDPPTLYERAIEEVVSALREDRTPLIDGRNAQQGMELIFASYESARRNARVNLPLDVDDNPLEAMIESGRLEPTEAKTVEA